MPGPTEVGQTRPMLARGALAALVVTALVATVAVVTHVRNETDPDATIRLTTRPASFELVPTPGATGTATCTDPVGQREWRVTWRAAQAVTTTPTPTSTRTPSRSEVAAGAKVAHAAGAAVPTSAATSTGPVTPTDEATPTLPASTPVATVPGSTTTGSPTAAGTSAAASASPGASPAPVSSAALEHEAELAGRAGAVTLVPTGFAVRALSPAGMIFPGSAPPASVPPVTVPSGPATTGSGTSTARATAYPTAPATTTAPTTTAPATTAPTTTGATTTAPAGPVATTGPVPGSPTPSATPSWSKDWTPRDADNWLLRWSPSLAETVAAPTDEDWVRAGPLTTLAAIPMSVRQDPRYVTPDGSCTVYLAPFVSGTAKPRNTVAVIGDSLVAQLYASEDGTPTGTGWLLNRLLAAGDRAEIAGQGGRRWTIKPNADSTQVAADLSMLDEIRGLRNARSVVIALGTNDVGWVALAPNREQYELRLAWVLLHLAPILDELRDDGHCTVVTTMATRNKNYVNTQPGVFDGAAIRINSYLRERANADPNDRLRLWDWATLADGHGTTDPEPWFGADTIHLNQAGHAAYADNLASAAALC